MNVKQSDLSLFNHPQSVAIKKESNLLIADIALNSIDYAMEYNIGLEDAMSIIEGVWQGMSTNNQWILEKYERELAELGYNLLKDENGLFSETDFNKAGRAVSKVCKNLLVEFNKRES